MKIKPRKNEHSHNIVDCPFCDHWTYLRAATKVSPDPLRDLKRHITNAAKNEAFALNLGKEIATPHLDYYKAHTVEKKIVLKDKREYDNDMTI